MFLNFIPELVNNVLNMLNVALLVIVAHTPCNHLYYTDCIYVHATMKPCFVSPGPKLFSAGYSSESQKELRWDSHSFSNMVLVLTKLKLEPNAPEATQQFT